MQRGIADIYRAMFRLPLVFYMARSETRARYKRSVLGPLWLTAGAAIGVVGLGVVWSTILNQSKEEFIPSLTVGLLVWQFMASSVIESTGVFVKNAQVIRNIRQPYFIYPLQMVLRQLIALAHNLLVLLVVFAFYPPKFSSVMLLSVAGLIVVVFNLLWLSILLGMLGARFRDLEPLIQSLMPILFFLTPVLFKAGHAGLNKSIIWLNPFSYFISIIRDPLFGTVPADFVYGVTAAITVVGWSLALWLFGRRGARIAFWV